MLPDVAGLESPAFVMVCATIALAGLTRGFAGFGAAMTYMPIASAIMEPGLAAASLLVVDATLSLPLVVSATKICDWRTALPAAGGAMITVSPGAWVLTNTDPCVLRWILYGVVLLLLIILISGWRYTKAPNKRTSFGVGTVSGLPGGMTQLAFHLLDVRPLVRQRYSRQLDNLSRLHQFRLICSFLVEWPEYLFRSQRLLAIKRSLVPLTRLFTLFRDSHHKPANFGWNAQII